ncbi:NADH-quinone oxidoreductase subunit L [Cuniculiplasma sp. SKW3]|uniref:NADH-quinone oxidoreductase subunit L n=1 Tax=unclassified Cuniculiplasma TaxID=2619706 RepID=UPI003FD50AD8
MVTLLNYAWFIFLTPIIAAPIAALAGRKTKVLGGIIASIAITISLILSILVYLSLRLTNVPIYQTYNWFGNINAGIYVDHLALVMVLMVSFVSLMIHLFAIYYMKDDPRQNTYFGETALFTGGMLGLILSSNLLEFFLFWELVGLCSYLLIGFWFFKPNAASAAKKAFIVTRVGDLLFIIGLAILYSLLTVRNVSSPLSIPYLINNAGLIASEVGPQNLTIIGLLFLGGAAGKSAQFPLHVWIPDAMEGPTTVSALIHAATMVTAGVYLIARVLPLYENATYVAQDSVLFIGAFTAMFAGTMGIVMNDLKRILAYSTISQIGYMMASLGMVSVIGTSVIGFSIYHLVVHAVFKALLFMTAGAILIALMELRDVRKMGGLWKKMPVTITLMFIGSITLAAIPPTAAYFSKDTIIDAAYMYYTRSGGNIYSILPWIFLVIGALMTSLYTFRMFYLVAMGKPRSKLAEEARDPPIIALIPLMILAFLSLTLGIIQYRFYDFIYPATIHVSVPFIVEYTPLTMVIIGIIVIAAVYGTGMWKNMDLSKNRIYKIVKAKYYLDYLFTRIIAERTILPLSSGFSRIESGFSRDIEATGSGAMGFGSILRRIQNGIVEYYFVFLVIGVAVLMLILEIVGGI